MQCSQTYLIRLMDLCAELGLKIVPMFFGGPFGWELAAGDFLAWGKRPNCDLVKAGQVRLVKKPE